MKTLSLLVMLLCIYVYANCSVVINEICYDPISSDEGYEWIELYNNGSEEINLIGWQILSGGDEFVHDYTFPAILIRPGRYILIAEEFIDNAHLHTTLNLQNATDAVDGVRLISASGDYTDTILYGENNANNLIDDNQVAGVSFAPDTSQGSSLYRNPNGNDTNLCADDFLISQNPTPGYRNIHEVDLKIKTVDVNIEGDSLEIFTSILNLSTSDVDNSEASLRICLDGIIQFEGGLNSIISLTCIDTVVYVQYQDFVNPNLSVEVIHEGELNIVDNLWTTPIFTNEFEVYINELCPAPTPTNQEWIELYNPNLTMIASSTITLTDLSGNAQLFDRVLPGLEYVVLCRDSLALLNQYPNCPIESIIEFNNFPILNNDGDCLKIVIDNVTVDSVYYISSDVEYDCSLIRVDNQTALLSPLESPEFSTPGQPNPSIISPVFLTIELTQEDEMIHNIAITSNGISLNVPFIVTEKELQTGYEHTIYQDNLTVQSYYEFQFTSEIPNEGIYQYTYTFSDYVITENWYQDIRPIVVNEIMYDPLTNEPEWIELYAMNPGYHNLSLIVSEDTLSISTPSNEYIIITDTASSVVRLIDYYSLEPSQVLSGLPNLLNQGETIRLKYVNGNKEEVFNYNPDWSEQKGVSIERINPLISPVDSNWGASVDIKQATPGAENSIHREFVPATSTIEIENNPFSPYRDEKMIIKFALESSSAEVNCTVFDLRGRKVAFPATNQTISGEDAIFWDGYSRNNKKMLPGQYILLIKLDENGRKTKKQIPIAIGK